MGLIKTKRRILALIREAEEIVHQCGKMLDDMDDYLSEFLAANGVIVPHNRPIGVMSDGNDFNTDVYCPYCGTNLSGLYGDEPTEIIQCYQCGNYLDNTKIITKEEAEAALKGGK